MDLIAEIQDKIRATDIDAGRLGTICIGINKSGEMAREIAKIVAKWIREQEETTFCPDKGDEVDCYLVPTCIVNKLET